MERNTVCMAHQLRHGDRYYRLNDKKKEVLVLLVRKVKGLFGTNDVAFSVKASIYDHHKGDLCKIHEICFTKIINTHQVVFLRHTESDIAQQPLKLPNE